MKAIRRMISALLVLAMVTGMVPGQVFAEETTATEAVVETTAATEATTEPVEETTADTEAVTEPVVETTVATEAVTEPAVSEEMLDSSAIPEVTQGTCGDNLTWKLKNGVLTISGSGDMNSYSPGETPWCDSSYLITQVVLPKGLTSIGGYAFHNCGITYISIPETVTHIGVGAFFNCASLSQVAIPESVTSISGYAFNGCGNLRMMHSPDEENIGDYYNKQIVAIPSTVTAIGAQAFFGCAQIGQLILPEGIASIGDSAFSYCSGLKEVVLPESITYIGEYVFDNCTGLVSATLPSAITTLPRGMFAYCSSLTDIEIPATVTTIDHQVFRDCSALTDAVLPGGLTTLGSVVFENCTGLTSITIPAGVSTIGSGTFSGCTSLTDATIANGVSVIGDQMFSACTGLTKIIVPDSVTIIGESAFHGCKALTEVVLPDGLVEIGWSAFAMTALSQIALPDTVTTIGDSAFYGSKLTEIILPHGLKKIGVYTFTACSGLTKVLIPINVTTIDTMAFMGCVALTDVYYCGSEEAWKNITIGPSNDPLTSETVTIHYNWTSPNFENVIGGTCGENLTWTLKNGVLTISGYGAMAYGNQGAPWHEWAAEITEVHLPDGLTNILSSAFAGCSALRGIVIPDTVTAIYSFAFSGCSNLGNVQFGENVRFIEAYAFSGCTALKRLVMNDAVEYVARCAFLNCVSLKEVSLSYGLELIDSDAFENCPAIGQLIVPSSVTSIADDAFSGWKNLVFCCSPSAYAASYAIDNQIPLVTLTDEAAPESSYLDYSKSAIRANFDKVSNSGGLHLITDYAFKERITTYVARSGSAITSIRLSFRIPANARVTNVKVDGKWLNPKPEPVNGILTVPVTKTSDRVHVYMLLPQNTEVNTYAKVTFNTGSGTVTELIGTLNTPAPNLSISANSETANSKVQVTGSTIPGNTVRLSVDGKEQLSVKANQAGDFTATVSLGTIKAHQKYEIKATTVTADGLGLSDTVTVTGKEVAPEIRDFVIEHAGQTIRLSETPSGKGNMIYYQNMPFKFTIYFNTDRPDISGVFVKTSRTYTFKGVVYQDYDSIPAKWNANIGAYVAEGKFSCSPGKFTVCYVGGKKQVVFDDTYDFTAQENYSTVPKIWHEPKVTVIKNDGSTFEGVVTGADGSTIDFTSEKQAIPGGLTAANAEAQGYMKITDSRGNVVFLRKYENAGRYEIGIADFVVGDYMKFCLEEFTAAGKVINNIWDFISLIDETAVDTSEYSLVKRDIQASNLNSSMKQQALKKVEIAQGLDAMMTVGKWIGFGCSIAMLVVPGLNVAGAAMLAATVTATGFVFDEVQDATEIRINNMMYDLQEADPGLTVCFAMDPSGYLYDADTEKRIAGATVTAYYIPYDDSATFWDSPPAEDVYGEVWDASEWSQGNPMKTDADGRYAWDVPQGWWRVKAEHPNYETTWSEWLPVPPPQTEVNLAMKCISQNVETDFTGDGQTDEEDAVYLLWHTLFPKEYPINADADFNHDGKVTDEDAVYLLWHILFPEVYPL